MSSVADVGRVRPHLRQRKDRVPCEHLFNIKPPQQYIQGHNGSVSQKPPAPVREFICMNITWISFHLIDLKFWHGPSFHRNPPHQDEAKPADQDHLLERRRQSQPVQGLKPVEESSIILHHLDLHPKKGGILSLLSSFIICSLFFVFDNFNDTCVKSAVGILSASSDPQSS